MTKGIPLDQVMNIQELQKALVELRTQPRSVGINGQNLSDEQYRIEHREFTWAVYYSQRGKEEGLHQFSSESEACKYLLGLIDKDKTTRLAE